MQNMNEYRLWRAPVDGAPEVTSGGHAVTLLPGFEPSVLLHPRIDGKWPAGSIPVVEVVKFLEAFGPKP